MPKMGHVSPAKDYNPPSPTQTNIRLECAQNYVDMVKAMLNMFLTLDYDYDDEYELLFKQCSHWLKMNKEPNPPQSIDARVRRVIDRFVEYGHQGSGSHEDALTSLAGLMRTMRQQCGVLHILDNNTLDEGDVLRLSHEFAYIKNLLHNAAFEYQE